MAHVRREFSGKVKDAAWERCGGPDAPRCEMPGCGLPIVGTPVYDHILPDHLGGEPTLENCQTICRKCNSAKTSADQRQIGKMKRQRRANAGIRPKRGGFRGWRRFDGTAVYKENR